MSDRKHKPRVVKKRKFCGNRYTRKSKTPRSSLFDTQSSTVVSDPETSIDLELDSQDRSTNSDSISQTLVLSRSEKKLGLDLDLDDTVSQSSDSDSENIDSTDYDSFGNRIIDFSILKEEIEGQLRCRFCNGKVELREVNRQGLGSTLQFLCQSKNKKCEQNQPFSTCPTQRNFKNYSINRRSVFAMMCIGGSQAELETFCGLMDLPKPVSKSSYSKIAENVQNACVTVQAKSMSKAAEEEFKLAKEIEGEPVRDIDVSVDGSWMTKGHTSNIDATSLIGCNSGKVLDTETKSKVCKSCEYWTNRTNDEDNERIRNAQRKGTLASLEYRRAKRRAAKESKEQKEDGAYSTGAY
ncbi:hypothetical protein RRG08_013467 [Elysia crispata]|uniref:Mutator-like transposase domain-containing protein n=1 Tax=Elysia crispata TaxID=231223 RepID=A0AAE0ZXH4_9GAST|nr:hypothetical protein RRG08_013467 [Elysia crispata]